MDGNNSRSCTIAGFDISDAESSTSEICLLRYRVTKSFPIIVVLRQ
jgi:hypothetical protein